MAHIINRPHAIYCNGELIGILTNPDPIGNPTYIEVLLGDDGDNIELRPMHPSTDLAEAIRPLPETVPCNLSEENTGSDTIASEPNPFMQIFNRHMRPSTTETSD